MKYPYIGKSKVNQISVLFTSIGTGVWLCDEIKKYQSTWDEVVFENITREYLANTKVEIESEEHSFFIQELAFKYGYIWIDGSSKNIELSGGYIVFSRGSMLISHTANPSYSVYKKITIPLPPKEHEAEGISQLERKPYQGGGLWKPFIDKTIKKPEPKEWPQVGDEVLTASKRKAKLIATHDYHAWVKYYEEDNTFSLGTVTIATLSKPLTPEEELTSAFVEYEKSNSYGYSWKHLAKAIINGEIKGLSYKPE